MQCGIHYRLYERLDYKKYILDLCEQEFYNVLGDVYEKTDITYRCK